MDFLVHKFSEWLTNANIPHKLIEVKGGYIVQFINPDEDLKKLISSLFITIDTGKEVNSVAVRTPVNIFTSSGDSIIIEEKYYADILSTVQPILHDYIINRTKRQLRGY